jgi:hypothetical protein
LIQANSGEDLRALTIDSKDRLFLNAQLVACNYKTFIEYFSEKKGAIGNIGLSGTLTADPINFYSDSMNFLGRDADGNWYWGDNTGAGVFSAEGDLIDYFMVDWQKYTLGWPHVAPNGDVFYLGRSSQWVSLYRVRNVWDRTFEVGVLSDRNVRVRRDPDTSAEIIVLLDKGVQLAVVGQTEERQTISGQTAPWLKVRLADAQEGWIFGAFVEIKNGVQELKDKDEHSR